MAITPNKLIEGAVGDVMMSEAAMSLADNHRKDGAGAATRERVDYSLRRAELFAQQAQAKALIAIAVKLGTVSR